MSIGELVAVAPPPEKPLEAGRGPEDWKRVQEAIGVALPSDLGDFGMCYGTGRFIGDIQVYNPFAMLYRRIIDFECNFLRELKKPGRDRLPYDVHPDRPGLFPWGRDQNGNTMCWLTVGAHDEWPIVLKSDIDEFEHWELSMTSFLAKAFRNEILALIWNDEAFRPEELNFRQVTY